MKSENRRRHYYVKQAFQTRFILQFLSLLILGCLAFGLAVYLYSTPTLTAVFVRSKLRVMGTAEFLLPALLLMALIVTALVSFAAAIRLLFLSHKIAGPLYRLEKTAHAIGEGDFSVDVRLRADDELQDFAHSMGEMVGDLRKLAEAIKTQNARLRDIISEADRNTAVPKDFLARLKDMQGRLDEATGRFQV